MMIHPLTMMLLFISTLAFGQGDLPRGDLKPSSEFKLPESTSRPSTGGCAGYDASPLNGYMYISPSQEFLYILVKSRALSKGKKKSSDIFQYDFKRLNFVKFQWETLMSFQKSDISVVVPHGKYTDGISFLTFSEFQDGCFLGNAGGFSATLSGDYKAAEDRSVSSKTFPYGRYKVLPTSLGRIVAEVEKSHILEVDPNTFQKRVGLQFDRGVTPIYLDYETRRLTTVNHLTDPMQLELKLQNAKTAYKKMPLNINDKFVRARDQFAKLVFERDGRRLLIETSQEWTARKKNIYKLTLPNGWKGQDVSLYPRFTNATAVILASTVTKRKQKRMALIADLSHGKIIHSHIPRPGFYVSAATMGPFGKYAYFVVKNIRTGIFDKLFRFDLNRKYYRVLKNSVPNKAAKKN
ncbi:hypothetical protein N9D31_01680 [Oligoflexaceae bacterium]|nr:hypothetical protein [Oligoflexaceae bacterium]